MDWLLFWTLTPDEPVRCERVPESQAVAYLDTRWYVDSQGWMPPVDAQPVTGTIPPGWQPKASPCYHYRCHQEQK